MRESMLRHLDAPNMLTLTGLAFSLVSAMLAIEGRLEGAMLALIGCGVVDLLDGALARRFKRTELTAELGKQLDSLVDLASFGVAPALFGYCAGMRHPLQVLVLVAFAMASAFRLAYYNAAGMIEAQGTRLFLGLPTTYASLALPVAYLSHFWLGPAETAMTMTGVYGVLAIAMVSRLKIPRPGRVGYLALALLAVGLAASYGVAIATGR